MNKFVSDEEVRYWVLASLDSSFDHHLGQAENLSALFVAMNDEVFAIRELAVCIIGRLSCVNPAYAMPSLRKALIQVAFNYLLKNLIKETKINIFNILACHRIGA